MDHTALLETVHTVLEGTNGNTLAQGVALSPELVGVHMYEPPLLGLARADDPRWQTLRQADAVGRHFEPPQSWLAGASTVISLFFPLSEAVRRSNRAAMDTPSKAWLNARIDGQRYLEDFSRNLARALTAQGYETVVPSLAPGFRSGADLKAEASTPFTSNWSERHAAYICQLGTFGLSKGFITERGMAGRFTSVVTTLPLEPTPVRGLDIYENCTRCGVCAANCPTGAISPETGKDHALCSDFLKETLAANAPYYGCGKCQVAVPCEHCNPNRATRLD